MKYIPKKHANIQFQNTNNSKKWLIPSRTCMVWYCPPTNKMSELLTFMQFTQLRAICGHNIPSVLHYKQQHAKQPIFPIYFVPHNIARWAWTCTACQTLMHNYCSFWTMQCTKIVSTNLRTKIFDSPSDHKKQDSFMQYSARKTCTLWPGRHSTLCYLQALYTLTVIPNLSWLILFEIQFFHATFTTFIQHAYSESMI